MRLLPRPARRPVARPDTALDALRRLVRGHLAPVLRAEGLRGSGSAWTLPCDTHWALVGVESHPSEDERSVRFCPRLLVVGRAAWQSAAEGGLLPEVPPATVPSGLGWERRLPELVPGLRPAAEWVLRTGDDPADLAPSVLGPLRRHGLPALRDVLAAERARRPGCASCSSPADVALRAPRQRLFLCRRHAAAQRRLHGWEQVGRWPDLLGSAA